jgi:hypothetical protein
MGKATMDLLYNQAMVWLGMYFSPWAAVIGIGTTLLLFVVKVTLLLNWVGFACLTVSSRVRLWVHVVGTF